MLKKKIHRENSALPIHLLTSVCILFLILYSGCDPQPPSMRKKEKLEFDPDFVLPGSAVPAPIVNPRHGSVQEVGGTLKNIELVIGVEINGETRAYPLNMLSGPDKQLINDELGNEKILVSFCPTCFNVQVHPRVINGKELEFFVSGFLWEGNMVIKDTETESFWSVIRAEAMKGEYKGTQLDHFPILITTWGKWTELHPNTTVFLADRTESNFTTRFFRNSDKFVCGLKNGDGTIHFSYVDLNQSRVINATVDSKPIVLFLDRLLGSVSCFERSSQEQEFSFDFQNEKVIDQFGNTWNLDIGVQLDEQGNPTGDALQRVATMPSYKKAWDIFRPESQLWKSDSQ
ncbi:MAG: DUF3179 domain-containing (seleno)protein [Planctomycetota bacterium]